MVSNSNDINFFRKQGGQNRDNLKVERRDSSKAIKKKNAGDGNPRKISLEGLRNEQGKRGGGGNRGGKRDGGKPMRGGKGGKRFRRKGSGSKMPKDPAAK